MRIGWTLMTLLMGLMLAVFVAGCGEDEDDGDDEIAPSGEVVILTGTIDHFSGPRDLDGLGEVQLVLPGPGIVRFSFHVDLFRLDRVRLCSYCLADRVLGHGLHRTPWWTAKLRLRRYGSDSNVLLTILHSPPSSSRWK